MNSKLENAKKALIFYFNLVDQDSDKPLDNDNYVEIAGIVDDIVEGVKEELAEGRRIGASTM